LEYDIHHYSLIPLLGDSEGTILYHNNSKILLLGTNQRAGLTEIHVCNFIMTALT